MRSIAGLSAVFFILTVTQAKTAQGEPRIYTLTRVDAESRAIGNSLTSKKSDNLLVAKSKALEAQKAKSMPQVTLEGHYRYLSEVPTARMGYSELQFGQHNNYSVGPILSYKIYDGGADEKSTLSIETQIRGQEQIRENAHLKSALAARLAYGRLQGSLEELQMVAESLHIAQLQEQDVEKRLRVGVSSRSDVLAVKQEVNQLKLKFFSAQGALTQNINEIFALINENIRPEILIPTGAKISESLGGIPEANFILHLDDMAQTLTQLKEGVTHLAVNTHPGVTSLSETSASLKLAAESIESEAYPHVHAFIKSSYDYPNGPLDEKVWQNSLGLSFSLTLYDAGLRQNLGVEKHLAAKNAQLEKEELLRDFRSLWRDKMSAIHSLDEQSKILQNSIVLAEQEASIVERNHKAGAAIYLEVQRAHNQVLEMRIQLVRIKTRKMEALASLNYLSAHNKLQTRESTP